MAGFTSVTIMAIVTYSTPFLKQEDSMAGLVTGPFTGKNTDKPQ